MSSDIDFGLRHPFREISVRHARGVERETELALQIDDDDAAATVGA